MLEKALFEIDTLNNQFEVVWTEWEVACKDSIHDTVYVFVLRRDGCGSYWEQLPINNVYSLARL